MYRFCRGCKTESRKAFQRGSCCQSHPRRRWRDQRVRRYTCIRFQCDHYRFQRSSGRTGEVHRGPRESRHASVPRHLPGDRGCRGCHEGYAGSGIRGAGNRSCSCPPDVQASGVGTIAGSYVLDGKITRGSKARITRDGEQIFEGPLASLKRFKDDVKEVTQATSAVLYSRASTIFRKTI